jgi:hypothetical protein
MCISIVRFRGSARVDVLRIGIDRGRDRPHRTRALRCAGRSGHPENDAAAPDVHIMIPLGPGQIAISISDSSRSIDYSRCHCGRQAMRSINNTMHSTPTSITGALRAVSACRATTMGGKVPICAAGHVLIWLKVLYRLCKGRYCPGWRVR